MKNQRICLSFICIWQNYKWGGEIFLSSFDNEFMDDNDNNNNNDEFT